MGAASIHPIKTFDNYKSIPVKIKKLDDIDLKDRIKFMKIDVEGHELEVIKGATETIKKINQYYL